MEEVFEFYNVKKKEKVSIALADISKTVYSKESKKGDMQHRYAIKAIDEGTKLTKFVSKVLFDSLENVPTV